MNVGYGKAYARMYATVMLRWSFRPCRECYRCACAVTEYVIVSFVSRGLYVNRRTKKTVPKTDLQPLSCPACLQADPAIMADMEAAHKSYAEERWSLLSAEDVDTIKRQGWEKSFSNGVAGIVQPRHIKCLHTHFAHFLATGRNVVGKWTQEALDAGKHLPVSEDG